MTVGFVHIGIDSTRSTDCARLMVDSVRRVMPDVPIVQFTDGRSAAVPGVTSALRVVHSSALAVAVLEGYASHPGRWLFLDTDVIVQHDVRAVFMDSFDVAVAERAGTLRPGEAGSKFMTRMPFNKGAVFSRSQPFWQAALAQARTYKAGLQEWMGDQQAMNDVIASGAFAVNVLPSSYNYAPQRADEPVSDKAILHLKGSRKAWMPQLARRAA